jgi:hypothetical protein
MLTDSIKILPSKEIDKTKWDDCVRRNENGLIYARSFYLDAMADNWDGLVVGDYEAVMPLTWRRKFGIKYLYREIIFMQQLGIIGKVENAKMLAIIEFALKQFNLYGNIAFNFLNNISSLNGTTLRTNFVLDLNKSHEELFKNFVPSLQRNIRKAQKNNLQVSDIANDEAIEQYRKFIVGLNKKIFEQSFVRFKNFIAKFPDFVFAKKVVSNDGALLATALWLKDERRIYNVMPVTMPAGKALQSMPFLLDYVFQKYCGQNLLFDFEGSNMFRVKKFYEKFSPQYQPYFLYHFNRLPRLARFFKK